jgi:hypothetical protein
MGDSKAKSRIGADLPTVVYHGTSDIRWNEGKNDTLFLTRNRDDAANYAEEALIGDYASLGIDADAPPPSTAIVVEFQLANLTAHGLEFEPDWGWIDANNFKTSPSWQKSLKSAGSFCIPDFPIAMKSFGEISPAFDAEMAMAPAA